MSHSENILLTLHDRDIFPNVSETRDITWKDRRTGKAVIFNKDGMIALIGNRVHDLFLLPGGGIENDETITDGLIRECREETGCEIKIQKALGVTEDFRSREARHCLSYGYSAEVITHGVPTYTESEKDIGAYVKWVPLPEAIELFAVQEKKVKAGEVKFYNTCFNVIRDSLFIRQARDL